jgi:hypothetical protein
LKCGLKDEQVGKKAAEVVTRYYRKLDADFLILVGRDGGGNGMEEVKVCWREWRHGVIVRS